MQKISYAELCRLIRKHGNRQSEEVTGGDSDENMHRYAR